MLHKEPDGFYKIPRIIYADAYAVLAALSVMAGLLAERWLFFAEARHTVRLYYGASTA